jgi:hypothetical protein
VVFSLLVVAAGVVLIAARDRVSRYRPFERVPVMRVIERVTSWQPFIILVGLGWIALGILGLVT